jgi:hypothetical protein
MGPVTKPTSTRRRSHDGRDVGVRLPRRMARLVQLAAIALLALDLRPHKRVRPGRQVAAAAAIDLLALRSQPIAEGREPATGAQQRELTFLREDTS